MDKKGYLKKENIINFILYLIILIMPLIVINFSDYPRYVMGKVFFLYAATHERAYYSKFFWLLQLFFNLFCIFL